jgi:uncharacterized protein (DUF1684 family)
MHFLAHFFTALLLATSLTAPGQPGTPGDYTTKQLRKERAKKDKHFRRDEDSPLPAAERRAFRGLHYYPANPAYKVPATFVRDSSQAPFKMKTSTSRLPEYRKYGELHFQLAGKPLVLTVYQNLELVKQEKYRDYLFIPFTDETNGHASYGGGRYLDFRIPATHAVTLDFNQAYNPYCAYGGAYSCPIPPAENALPLAVEAGEKTYQEH